MHGLDGPATRDELGGEPVEQLWVRGFRTGVAEVVGIGEERRAEGMLPEAVHQHARGERVFGRSDPVGEGAAAAGGVAGRGADRGGVGIEDGEEAGRDFVARFVGIALEKEARGLGGLARVGHAERDGEGAPAFFDFVEAGGQIGVAFLFSVVQRGGNLLVGGLQFVEVGLEFFLGGLVAFGRVGFQKFQDVGGELGAALGGEAFLHGREHGGELLLRIGGSDVEGGVVGLDGLLLGREVDGRVVAGFDRGKERAEAEVIGLREGIVFVIVAVGAGEGEAEEGRSGRVDEVGHEFVARSFFLLKNGGGAVVGAGAEEAGGDELVGLRGRARRAGKEFVAGELFADELVVGLVLVEGADDVVAVTPHLGAELVALVAVGVGVAHDVEPVPRPPLAVARVGEERVHKLLVGARRAVVDEGEHFLGRWRQADEIEAEAADQRAAVGLGREGELLLGKLGEEEGIGGIANGEWRITNLRHGRARGLFERPEIKAFAAPEFADGIFWIGEGVAEFSGSGLEGELAGAGRVGVEALEGRPEEDAVEAGFVAAVAGRGDAGEGEFADVFPEVHGHDGPRDGGGGGDGDGRPAGGVRAGDVAALGIFCVGPGAVAGEFDQRAAAAAFFPGEAKEAELAGLR